MDTSKQTVIVAYIVSKILSYGSLWMSGYISERDMSDTFISTVYLGGKETPELTRQSWTFIMSHVGIYSAISLCMAIGMYITHIPKAVVVAYVIFMAMDISIVAILGLLACLSAARTLSTKKYFNYKLEGLRAIRALRIISNSFMQTISIIPFSVVLGDSTTGVAKRLKNTSFPKMSLNSKSVK